MEALTLAEMESLAGGGWLDFIDGVCGGVALVALLTSGTAVANPVGGSILGGCVVYGVVRLMM